MYSFFLFRHSLAASRFFSSLISLFLVASSILLPAGLEAPPPPLPLGGEEAEATEMICGDAEEAAAAAAATVPGIKTVWPFCVLAAY